MPNLDTSVSASEFESAMDISPPRSGSVECVEDGVGLSNPQLSHGRRQMLDLVNRLHSTG
jgi:hypothetical protein